MKKLIFLLLLGGFYNKVYSTTYYTVANGAWSGSIWGTCSTCTAGTLPALNDGDVLVIDDRVTIASTTITITARIRIELTTDDSPNTSTTPAKLIFSTGGKLALGAGSSVVLINLTEDDDDPIIDGSGAGGSNTITIGGTEYWRASDGDRQGTGTLQPDSTLPVKIALFEGKKAGDDVLVTWITSMESGFSHFNLLHSTNGISYELVASLPGRGIDISGIEKAYSILHDQSVLGLNYYRLQAVDLDGQSEYFGPIAVRRTGEKQMTIYPNPTSGNRLKIKRNFDSSEHDLIVVMNQFGQHIFSTFAGYIEDELTLNGELAPGMYIVKYVGEGFESVSNVIVTK